jgi:hypothetical protein
MLMLPTSATEFLPRVTRGSAGRATNLRAGAGMRVGVASLEQTRSRSETARVGEARLRGAGHRLEVVVELPSTQDETGRGPHMARLAG